MSLSLYRSHDRSTCRECSPSSGGGLMPSSSLLLLLLLLLPVDVAGAVPVLDGSPSVVSVRVRTAVGGVWYLTGGPHMTTSPKTALCTCARIPRAAACGSANASVTELMGPNENMWEGTRAASKVDSQCDRGCVASTSEMSGTSAALLAAQGNGSGQAREREGRGEGGV